MGLITDKFVFLHIPKTGGTWFQTAVSECLPLLGLAYTRTVGHDIWPVDFDEAPVRPVMMFKRHPMAWLRSLWMHEQRSGHMADFRPMPWADKLKELSQVSNGDFRRFVHLVADAGTIVSDVFNAYRFAYDADIPEELFFVSHTENMVAYTLLVFEQMGIINDANNDAVTDVFLCLRARSESTGAVPGVSPAMTKVLETADPDAFEPYRVRNR